MMPSFENIFKRGADLYYSRRNSYPLFEVEFRPSDNEWIYSILIRGNSGRVASCRCSEFNNDLITRMIENLLYSEDAVENAMRIESSYRTGFIDTRNIFQRVWNGEIRHTGDRVHFDLHPGLEEELDEE